MNVGNQFSGASSMAVSADVAAQFSALSVQQPSAATSSAPLAGAMFGQPQGFGMQQVSGGGFQPTAAQQGVPFGAPGPNPGNFNAFPIDTAGNTVPPNPFAPTSGVLVNLPPVGVVRPLTPGAQRNPPAQAQAGAMSIQDLARYLFLQGGQSNT